MLNVRVIYSFENKGDEFSAAVVKILFHIPIDGATDSRKFVSNVSWNLFCYEIAGEIGVKKDTLDLAYRFNTAPQKELPKLLKTSDHFLSLWNNIYKERANLASKKSKKELEVILINRGEMLSKKKSMAVCFISIFLVFLLIVVSGKFTFESKTSQGSEHRGVYYCSP